jgi:ribosome modulation factor
MSPTGNRSYVSLMEQPTADRGRVFAEGYLAGISGDERGANPQKDSSSEAAACFEGWEQGTAKRALNTTPSPENGSTRSTPVSAADREESPSKHTLRP